MEYKKESDFADGTVYKIFIVQQNGYTEIYARDFSKILAIKTFFFEGINESLNFSIPFTYGGITPDLNTIVYTAVLLESEDSSNTEYLEKLKEELVRFDWELLATEVSTQNIQSISKEYTN